MRSRLRPPCPSSSWSPSLCSNCRIELPPSPGDTTTNTSCSYSTTERLSEFISYHEGYEVKVTIKNAILTVFELALKLNNVNIPPTRSIEMCSQCTAVLAELYRFYVEFMKLSRDTSYMQDIIKESVLWDFPNLEEDETDNKKFIQQQIENNKLQEGVRQVEEAVAVDDIDYANYPDVQPSPVEEADENCMPKGKRRKRSLVVKPAKKEKPLSLSSPTEKFHCTVCSKEFTRKSDTTRHMRAVHKDLLRVSATPTTPVPSVSASATRTTDQKTNTRVREDDKNEAADPIDDREVDDEADREPEFEDDTNDEDYVPNTKEAKKSTKTAAATLASDVGTSEKDRLGVGAGESQDPATIGQAAHQIISTMFKCEQCQKTFRRKDYLKAHERSHMTPEEKQKEFQQRKTLERLHRRSKARKPMINRSKVKVKHQPRKKKPTYHCSECNLVFPTRETMKYHRRKIHPKATFPCTVSIDCKRIFHSENDLKIHENVKHGIGEKLIDRICPVPGCGKYFALPNIMKRHVQSVHCEDKDRVFGCPFCPLKFPIKNRLDTHLKNRHNSDNSLLSLKCEYCERIYETRSGLSQHIETVHTNLQVYSCDICGKTSIRPEWLKKHLELHDEAREKKFGCSECGMKFYRNASLKKHMKNHSGAKNYLCSECGDKFRQTSSLRRHIEAKHQMKHGPFTCDQCGKSFKIKEYLAQHLRAKSHGGRGHGLYTPAGKRRLAREREQQVQSEIHEEQPVQSFPLQQPNVEVEQFQLVTGSEGTTTATLIDNNDHVSLAAANAAQLVDVKIHEIQIPILIEQVGAKQESSIHHLGTSSAPPAPQTPSQYSDLSSNPNTPGSSSTYSSSLPSTSFQGTPIQFITTINPAWFQQTHSQSITPPHSMGPLVRPPVPPAATQVIVTTTTVPASTHTTTSNQQPRFL